MALAKAIQPAQQPLGAQRRLDADSQRPGDIAPIEGLHAVGEPLESIAQSRQQRLAGFGQLQLAVEAHEKGGAEMGFQRFDLVAHGRGGYVQLVGGGAEAAQAAGGLEGPEAVQGRESGRHVFTKIFLSRGREKIVCASQAFSGK